VTIALCLALLISCSSAQTRPSPNSTSTKPQEAATALEAFLGKRGRLIVKDYYSLGRISGMGSIELKGLVIYEPGGTQKIKGLRAEVAESGRLERTNNSFIDLDELESLSQALTYMIDLAKKWNGLARDSYTEVIYTSKGEFQVGFYQQSGKLGAFCRSGSIGPADAFIEVADLEKMKTLVDQARALLASK
jgi:hypothetical protein